MSEQMERGRYGVLESNHWDGSEVQDWLDTIEDTVYLSDPRLARIARLRLLSDPGFPFWDVSYCYGVLKDGTRVRVSLPRHQFGKRTLKQDLIEMCREAGVYGKGLGLFEPETISRLV